MKKILFRKLLFDCLKFFFLSAIGIGSVVWVFQAVNYLDIMVEDGRNYFVYLQYTFLNFPKIIHRIIPFIFFISLFYMLIDYEMKNQREPENDHTCRTVNKFSVSMPNNAEELYLAPHQVYLASSAIPAAPKKPSIQTKKVDVG